MTARLERVEMLVEAVRAEFAPDPRMEVFEVEVEPRGDGLALTGATSNPEAATALHARIAALSAWAEISDEVVRLPEAVHEEVLCAIVNAAVAPMLVGPRIATTQISQAVLGSRLTVLRRTGRWLQCRSGDGYIGWVHVGYVALMDDGAARAWAAGADGEPWISLGAELLDERGDVLMRLPWGARVVREGADAVRLPDGRRGRPVGELLPAALRERAFPKEPGALCATAARWLGVPYLWGGLTMGGVDCSGFVQTVFRMHGVELPRDSDQQSRAGEVADPGERFDQLRPGDLAFFAEEPGRCTHVVLSCGGGEIIHSSLGNAGVARNRLDGRRNYERELRRIFLCARRVL